MTTFVMVCGAYCAGALTVLCWDYIAAGAKALDGWVRKKLQERRARKAAGNV